MVLVGFSSLMRAVFGQQNLLSQWYPPTATFSPERDIPDQSGKVVLVTGGNGGIGYETCKHLLRKGAKVYMAARSPSRASEAAARLQEETGRLPEILHLDLGDLTSVRKSAEEFLEREPALHTLYNNAGAVWVPIEMITEQGYDLSFGTNVLGHYFLTMLLMPALKRCKETTSIRPRIINVSSSAHIAAYGHTGIIWETMAYGPERTKRAKSMGPYALYCQSKMGTLMLSYLFDRHYGDTVCSIALNPGNFHSNAYRYVSRLQMIFVRLVLYTVDDGCKTQLWAGTAPEGTLEGGDYLIPWARKGSSDPRSHETNIQDKLWEWLQEQVTNF